MKKFILFSLIFFVMHLNSVFAQTYKIGAVQWIGCSPLHVAQVKNFWKDQGIEVKVVNLPNPSKLVEYLENNVTDIGYEMIGTIVGAYVNSQPLTIIMETDWSNGGDKIIMKKNMEFFQIKDKPIGMYLDSASLRYFIAMFLAKHSMNIADFRFVEMESKTLTNNFIENRFNVIINFDPESIRAVKEGNGIIAGTSADYDGCIPEGLFIKTENLNVFPKEDIIKILNGWIKASEWIHNPENWNEYVNILNQYTFKGLETFSEEDLKQMLDSIKIHDSKTLFERNKKKGGLESYLKQFKTFLSDNNLLKKEYKIQDIFNNQFIMDSLSKH